MHSALKHHGQRLYKLAHQGITVEREPREVVIRRLECTHWDQERIELEIECSKGTYVRTLSEDLGEALGSTAHVDELRRTGSGPFGDEDMISLVTLQEEGRPESLDRYLTPMEAVLAEWPAVSLSPDTAWYLHQGQPVRVPRAPTEGWVRLHGADDRFIGVGEVLDDGRIAPRRLIGARPGVRRLVAGRTARVE